MSKRSKARQVAVQMLFQNDYNTDVDVTIIKTLIADRLNDQPIREFSWQLYHGVMSHIAEIDQKIQQVASNWKLERMAATDRAILRLGTYELNYTQTPVGVAIDECIELAKKFGSSQSSMFVNGVLDRVVPLERRDPRRPVPGPMNPIQINQDPVQLPEGAILDSELKKLERNQSEEAL